MKGFAPVILVSAIVPTYNRSYIVRDAIISILSQTYPHVEVIVVDDGSTDDTLQVLAEFGNKISVISQANAGPAAARNRGIQESQGEILTFLDSDDLWLPTYLERQILLLERAGQSIPCSISNCWLQFPDGNRRTTFHSADLNPSLGEGIWLNPEEIFATRFVQFNQVAAVRRHAMAKIGLFDSKLKYLEDWDFALRLSLLRPWCFIRDPLVVWRQQKQDSLSRVAIREKVLVRATAVTVLAQALKRFRDNDCSPVSVEYLTRELKRNGRKLFAARMSERGRAGGVLGGAMKYAEQIRESAWTYPKMETLSVE